MNCNTSVYVQAACTASNAGNRSFRVEFVSVCLSVCLLPFFKQIKSPNLHIELMPVFFFSGEHPFVLCSNDRASLTSK